MSTTRGFLTMKTWCLSAMVVFALALSARAQAPPDATPPPVPPRDAQETPDRWPEAPRDIPQEPGRPMSAACAPAAYAPATCSPQAYTPSTCAPRTSAPRTSRRSRCRPRTCAPATCAPVACAPVACAPVACAPVACGPAACAPVTCGPVARHAQSCDYAPYSGGCHGRRHCRTRRCRRGCGQRRGRSVQHYRYYTHQGWGDGCGCY